MAPSMPPFSMGIEEEYLLVDRQSLDLVEAPEALMEACKAELEGQVSPEFLACQIEIGTKVCADIAEAREDLKRLRACVAKQAATFDMAPIAVSCHPFADWKHQTHTDKERYNTLEKDLAGVARRMLICGMHVHVGLDDNDLRNDLMGQLSYFLPHLLALSTSSPYWQGQDTGLASYRLTIFDNLPRTGLPPHFDSWSDYRRSVDAIIELGLVEDSSKIWWDLRPSHQFPTLETRICDVMPRLEHTVSVAALIQSLARMLTRLRQKNQRWRLYDRFLVGENRWRAQRYGVGDGLIDFGRRALVPMNELLDEIIELVQEDADALGCLAEVEGARNILRDGTSSERQRGVYDGARVAERDHDEAMRDVVRHLIEEYHADL
ncbi:carboxylate-amine ligase [Rhodophyticola porphyridii]|uniref:Putative glutamate--cysteine ligase 2 n=1 Tax=Rhodophyticola porphyridii TaxID=1852017 RepID=A0A3L9Y7A5_9RHOB|nr:carboxylate-amine ligase [Rhodophyticola porphyridii]RMA42193.1 carboxylate-amine ligase [Rhodophyticola porphyridii]